MSLLDTLKDVSLAIGVTGFTFWQWTNPRSYKFKPRKLCRLRVPYWQIWVLLYVCLAVSWLGLLFLATPTMQYLLANTVLMISGLVLNKLWTVFAADLVAMFPARVLALNIVALFILLSMIGLHIAYLALTALDGAWLAFGFSVPYPIWLALAAWLSMPLHEPLVWSRLHNKTEYKSPMELAPDSDDDDTLMITPSLYTGKRLHSGLRNTHLL